MSARHTCPCCGFRTLDEGPGAYDLCPVCFWEDDGSQGDDRISVDGPNGITLAEAQRRYRRHGSSDLYALAKVRPPRPDEPRDPDWQPEPVPDGLDESTAFFAEDFGTLLYVRVLDAFDRTRTTRTAEEMARFHGLRAALELWIEQSASFGNLPTDAGIPPGFDLGRDLRLDIDHGFA